VKTRHRRTTKATPSGASRSARSGHSSVVDLQEKLDRQCSEAGTIVPVNIKQFGRWLDPTKQFIEWADKFFLGFLASKEKIGRAPTEG
jgi:hypothetical protein